MRKRQLNWRFNLRRRLKSFKINKSNFGKKNWS